MEALMTQYVLLTEATYWRYIAKLETTPESIRDALEGVISGASIHPDVFSEFDKENTIEAIEDALKLSNKE